MVKIQWIDTENKIWPVTVKEGTNLLDICRKYGFPLAAASNCNGNGLCGKCIVQIVQGKVPVTKEQQDIFTVWQLAAGYRLACQVEVTEDITFRTESCLAQGQKMQIQVPMEMAVAQRKEQHIPKTETSLAEYDIAVDLGSTTLVAVLLDAAGEIVSQATAVNSQRCYGADVISRIQASNEGKQKELQAYICRDLENLFRELVHESEPCGKILRIAIAGNTTMLHLLRGYSCETLGKAPFEPVNLKLECLDYREIFEEIAGFESSKIWLLPGVSAFVGSDIVVGLYSSGFWQMPEEELAFFVDLGTNGELVCGNRKGFVAASAPAGPALEGGCLSCGIPGIPGAISNVSFLYHRVRIQTIGQKKPCGVCGTGALEAVAALLQEGLMDADGLLAASLFAKGILLARREDGSGIYLTQADIREIQMAKAAIRAGIDILMRRYQEEFHRLAKFNRVYLSGGFGYYLSADTAIQVGLFPEDWKEKIVLCGNTSLKGAVAFLTDSLCRAELEKICSKDRSVLVKLESDPHFQDVYMSQMRFCR